MDEKAKERKIKICEPLKLVVVTEQAKESKTSREPYLPPTPRHLLVGPTPFGTSTCVCMCLSACQAPPPSRFGTDPGPRSRVARRLPLVARARLASPLLTRSSEQSQNALELPIPRLALTIQCNNRRTEVHFSATFSTSSPLSFSSAPFRRTPSSCQVHLPPFLREQTYRYTHTFTQSPIQDGTLACMGTWQTKPHLRCNGLNAIYSLGQARFSRPTFRFFSLGPALNFELEIEKRGTLPHVGQKKFICVGSHFICILKIALIFLVGSFKFSFYIYKL